MAVTIPAFTTTASITGQTLIADADGQLNILMGDVKDYVEDTYTTVASSVEAAVATHASNAQQSATASELSAYASQASADASQASVVLSQGYAEDAEESKELSRQWAEAPEGVLVEGTGHSAYHWAKVAESVSLGDIYLDSLQDATTAGKVDGSILRYSGSSSQWAPYDFTRNTKVGFNTSAPASISEGEMAWNPDEGTLDLALSNMTLQVGQEQVIKVRNNTALPILNGKVVMATGTIGNSGRITIAPANLTPSNAKFILGVVTQTIAAGADGFCTVFGKVRGIQTNGSAYGETWVDGDVLYAKDSGNGALTKVPPTTTQVKLPVAIVVHAHNNNGTLFVRINSIDENTTARVSEEIDTVRGELLIGDSGSYAQHGLVPNDGVNEIRPQDMFEEVNVADVLVDKKGYPVRFTDGVYDRLGEELNTGNSYAGYTNSLITNERVALTPFLSSLSSGTAIKITISMTSVEGTLGFYAWGTATEGNKKLGETTRSGTVVLYHMLDEVGLSLNFYSISSTLDFTIGYISVKELPQFALPKAPFATGSTDGLLDDKVNGLTTQVSHSKGDIVVTGNELVTNGTFDTDVSGWVTQSTGTITHVVDRAEITAAVVFDGAKAIIGAVVGQKYVLSFDGYRNTSSQYTIRIANSEESINTEYTNVVQQRNTVLFTATDTTVELLFRVNVGTGSFRIDNISVKLADQSYIALTNTTAGALLSDTTKFKAIPYVTKQVALLIEKTSAGTILNTVKPLVNMYGESDVEDYEAAIFGELGYSQKADRVWTDGSSEYILIGLKGYTNSGAFSPIYNVFGSRKFSDNSFWYNTTDTVGGTYDCF